MIDYLLIIQARLGSTRFPNKVLQTVGGVPMVRRVWLAGKTSWADQVIVAWPERYPDVDENDVLERFKRIALEIPSKYVIRLTADCPLITSKDINEAIREFNKRQVTYYNNQKDGFDVQVFTRGLLFSDVHTHKEHVFKDFNPPTGLSVNNKEDLERVRRICKTK